MSHQVTRSPGRHEPYFRLNFAMLLTRWLCVFVAIVFCSRAYALNLDNLKVCFLKGDYKSAITEGEAILANAGGSSVLDELYYYLGLCYLKDGNYLRASDIFEIILTELKDSKFHDEAQLGLGDTYLLRGDFSAAEERYGGLLDRNPGTKLKAQLLYRLSQTGFKKGDTQQAREYLDKLKQDFPLNPELRLNKELSLITGSSAGVYYTVQVGAFSNTANARNLTQSLAQKGYPAYIEEVTFQDKPSYRVRVGKFGSLQQAADLEKKLAQEGYPTKICP